MSRKLLVLARWLVWRTRKLLVLVGGDRHAVNMVTIVEPDKVPDNSRCGDDVAASTSHYDLST
jgi:hypothetical protein